VWQARFPANRAEFERTMIRQRIKAGLKRAVAQGVKLGRPKIGSATERKVRKQLAWRNRSASELARSSASQRSEQ
jgi:DNA invertase Pin-like site-specific DNA recombinase